MWKFTLLIAFSMITLQFMSIQCEEQSFIEITMPPSVGNFASSQPYFGELFKHQRVARSQRTCKLPNEENKNFELKCKLYPSKTECIQRCMFGYTFSEGIERVMKCKHDENRWMPVPDFQQCQPFIDCSLTLGQGGSSKCTTHHMDKGPVCDVSCSHFEDKEAVPLKQYSCDVRGNWTPELPFCVKAGSGLSLVPRPRGF